MAWIPAGTMVSVAGRDIPGGMVYFGSGGTATNGFQVEPAQIDPSLPVDWRPGVCLAAQMGYWPSYDGISPACRGTYLSWLASDRSDPNIDIGHVFLYFYGLERRALVDTETHDNHPELAPIAMEITRLLAIYGANNSFNTYASGLLNLITPFPPADLQASPPALNSVNYLNYGMETPLHVRLWLGQCVASGNGIPDEWALTYLRSHPESGLRTAASRCPSEFDTLFRIRYRQRFKNGIVVKPPKSVVEVTYRAASPGLAGQSRSRRFDGVPDVTRATGLINRLRELGVECSDSLSAYSRFLGRADRTSTDSGVGLLPGELLATHGGAAIAELREWAQMVTSTGIARTIAVDDLLAKWSPRRIDKLTKADAVAVASLLSKLGVGIEPDVRFGDALPVSGSSAVVYPLPTGATSAPGPHYAAASVLAYLCAVVASADGSVSDDERQQLSAHLEATLGLDIGERRRLEALLSWLVATRAGLSGIKKRVDRLDHARRAAIGNFLVDVAAADGVVTPAEITTLTKLFKLLSLDEGAVYSAIHAIGSDDTQPVSVLMPEKAASRWQIPASIAEPGAPVRLDPAKVRARLAETATVTAMLADIFAEDPEIVLPTKRMDAEPIPVNDGGGKLVVGLDSAHSELVRRFCLRPTWTRAECEDQASAVGLLLLDGAIDRINEAAMDLCGEPLIEGDDPLQISNFAAQEVL